MRPIKEGDQVVVTMARDNCFEFQCSRHVEAVVQNRPSDVGDLWYFHVVVRVEGDVVDEVDIAVNPLSSDFVGIVKK